MSKQTTLPVTFPGTILYFGTSAQFWLNLQDHYDLESTSEKTEAFLKEIIPYKELKATISA